MTETPARTDTQLQRAIVEELEWTPNVGSEHIGVAVTDAAVTLSGEVRDLPEKIAAVRAAFRVGGVTALADELVVEHRDGRHNDADLARAVEKVLDGLVQLVDADITATVHTHVVSLAGTVDWNYQREAARKAVSSIAGVTGVVCGVTVRPVATTTGTTADITQSLVRGARSTGQQVGVEVDGHVVTLSGHVHSVYERREAERAAWSARGITEVRNRLSIAP